MSTQQVLDRIWALKCAEEMQKFAENALVSANQHAATDVPLAMAMYRIADGCYMVIRELETIPPVAGA